LDSERRRKLLERARAIAAKTVANGCTEGEALAASEKLAELLDELDMELDDLNAAEAGFSRYDQELVDDVWIRLAAIRSAIATLTGTKAWTDPTQRMSMSFFGRDPDVQIASYLLAIAERALRSGLDGFMPRVMLYREVIRRRKRLAFIDGMVQSMKQSIEKIAWARQPQTGTGLVVVKHRLVEAELARQGFEFSRARPQLVWDHDNSFSRGRREGERVSFEAGLERGDDSTQRLLGR